MHLTLLRHYVTLTTRGSREVPGAVTAARDGRRPVQRVARATRETRYRILAVCSETDVTASRVRKCSTNAWK